MHDDPIPDRESDEPPMVLPIKSDLEDIPEVRPIPAKPPSPHPHFLWALLWCVGFLMLTQIPAGVIGAAFIVADMLQNPPPKGQDPPTMQEMFKSPAVQNGMMIGVAAAQILGIGFSIIALRLVAGRDWSRQIAIRLPHPAHALMILLAFPGLAVVSDSLYMLFKEFLPGMSQLGSMGMEEMVEGTKSWPWVIAVLCIGLGPGLSEELWCRGFLGRGLVGYHGVLLGVLFSSFLFGLIHIDPPQGAMAAVMGLALHGAYLCGRSILLPMLLHFLNNSGSMVTVSESFPKGTGIKEAMVTMSQAFENKPTVVVPAAAALVMITGIAFALSRTRYLNRDGTVWKPAFPGPAMPPRGSDTDAHTPFAAWPLLLLVAAAAGGFWWVVYQAGAGG